MIADNRSSHMTTRIMAGEGVGYEITQPSRQRRSFGLIPGLAAAADRHLTKNTLGRLRELCRMHDRQSGLFSGILNRALDNIFGANFDFIPTTGDIELNKTVKAYITERMKPANCDAAGLKDFAEMAKTSLRGVWNDGDSLLAKRPNGTLLAFEADQIETPHTKYDATQARMVLGVELDEFNGHAAYWVKQRQTRSDYGTVSMTAESKRIAAANAIVPAYRTRHNQTRGVPFLAAILGRFDRTNNYLDYESVAAELNAMLGWKITKQTLEDQPAGSEDNDDVDSTYDKVQKMEPGLIFDLLEGEDIDMIGSQRPGTNFESYIIMSLRIIGVGIGMPLELVLLDFSKTSYSSARASLGEARRMFRVWQRFSGQTICMPWYSWQITRGIATGELPAAEGIYKSRVQWAAWEYIDPLKEANGNRVALANRTKSISQCIRETGGEPDEVYDEIASDAKKLATLGIIVAADAVNNKVAAR